VVEVLYQRRRARTVRYIRAFCGAGAMAGPTGKNEYPKGKLPAKKAVLVGYSAGNVSDVRC
jgi:hypothetical protein